MVTKTEKSAIPGHSFGRNFPAKANQLPSKVLFASVGEKT